MGLKNRRKLTERKTELVTHITGYYLKIGPNDLVRGLFISLDIGSYIVPSAHVPPFEYLFGQEQLKKNIFWLFWTIFPKNYGPNDLVRGLCSSLDIGPYILPTCWPLNTFLGPFEGAQMATNSINKHNFLVVLDHFS
jgi:hypothetical protein